MPLRNFPCVPPTLLNGEEGAGGGVKKAAAVLIFSSCFVVSLLGSCSPPCAGSVCPPIAHKPKTRKSTTFKHHSTTRAPTQHRTTRPQTRHHAHTTQHPITRTPAHHQACANTNTPPRAQPTQHHTHAHSTAWYHAHTNTAQNYAPTNTPSRAYHTTPNRLAARLLRQIPANSTHIRGFIRFQQTRAF